MCKLGGTKMNVRRFTRYLSDIPFSLAIKGILGKNEYHIKDIGQGGLAFDSLACIDQGTPVHISFPLAKEPCDINAKIAWCTPLVNGFCSLGIVFEESVTHAAIEKIALVH